jgi:hypothetical protein
MNINTHLKKCAEIEDTIHLNSSVVKMQTKLDEYWPKIKDDALIFQLLDPGFKHTTL